MGVGSQRAALESDAVAKSYNVRAIAPDALLFANLGAVQLNYGYGLDECRRAVDMIEADALILHLNPLQEALQPEGDTRWAALLGRIEQLAGELDVPIIAKEVGFGITGADASRLASAGVSAIDVAGAGGTSWSEVEKHRGADAAAVRKAAAFSRWGLPTADALIEVRRDAPGVEVVASGGLRDGMDVAKSVALGASLAGLAGPFLRAATQSTEAVIEEIDILVDVLRVVMFGVGAASLVQLRENKLVGPVEGKPPSATRRGS
jgi:isopentenyl-diphosphate delta-isomerase